MIGFIVTSLQLQSVITAHTLNSFRMSYEKSLTSHSLVSDWPLLLLELSLSLMLRPTVSRPVRLGVKPHLGPKNKFYYCQTVAGLFISDERTGLSFTIAAGPRQRSHCRIRVLRNSWPHFTVSDSRLPQPGGPGPRIYIAQWHGGPVIAPSLPTVEVVEPASMYGTDGSRYTSIASQWAAWQMPLLTALLLSRAVAWWWLANLTRLLFCKVAYASFDLPSLVGQMDFSISYNEGRARERNELPPISVYVLPWQRDDGLL
jgi:hypothetical protein